jgi:N-formylglutamate deformylase
MPPAIPTAPSPSADEPALPWVRVLSPDDPLQALPLVCDSPHSGLRYPADFGAAITPHRLRSGEDTHVDRLWDATPAVGGPLVLAEFPRSYIDANRAADDLDLAMLDAPWPGPVAPSAKSIELGIGLIWRQVAAGEPIYDRLLTVAEVQARIQRCWQPYQAALRSACDTAHARFGACWHLNLHSMPSNAYERLGRVAPHPLADVVLGDLHGRSCAAGFTTTVRDLFEDQGLRVAVNDPYAGQELVRRMGAPAQRRHSLQVELNRALYMDEATREPNAGFAALQAALGRVLQGLAARLRARALD